jgi:hypothetical protein
VIEIEKVHIIYRKIDIEKVHAPAYIGELKLKRFIYCIFRTKTCIYLLPLKKPTYYHKNE